VTQNSVPNVLPDMATSATMGIERV